MPQYISRLRRGTKNDEVNDWARYEADPNHVKPLAGELVLEYDYGIPRLKIGDGIHEFSELPYMSVDSFILPKPISVTLYSNKWEQVVDEDDALVLDTYSQVVTVDNAVITSTSKIDLQPTLEQLTELYDLGIALTTENNDGIVTVYSVGTIPKKQYTIQATVTEIIIEDEVIPNE